MAVSSGFFNSSNGDRVYNADDMSHYFEGIVSSGVFANPSNNLQVTANGENMVVSVQPGRGIIDCRWIDNDSVYNITLNASDALLNRIDAIVMRYDIANRKITLELKTGTPATTPTAPIMLRSAATVEYCLAYVQVNAGVTIITQANITDTRANSDVCGWITNLVSNIDITALYAQWQAKFDEQYEAFNELYEQIKTTLQVPTKVKKYEETFTTTASTTTIAIPVAEYEAGDALLIHLGGILLREGADYTVSGTNITFPDAVAADRDYTFIVFKCEV